MNRAIIYARFSPRRFADQCESIDVQVAACKTYCTRMGLEIAGDPFEDREASRNDADRPGLWNAIASLKRGMVLVVSRRDRLVAGDLGAVVNYRVHKAGAMIHAVDGSINDDSPLAKLTNSLLDAVSEFDRQMIGVRTRHAMRHHQSQNRAMSSLPPFGKKRGPDHQIVLPDGTTKIQKTWEDDPAEQAIIRHICDMNGTPHYIATTLNQRGIPCRGKLWRHDLVGKILARCEAVREG